MDDLHALPKFRDSMTHLYVERARVDREEKALAIWDEHGMTPVPAASLCVLMLGPGTTITQAAVAACCDNNCLLIWCGEQNVRFYACGTGATRSAARLIHQARLASDEALRWEVVRRMYCRRFREEIGPEVSIEQMRGKEGYRVREAYARFSRETGVPWTGRSYERNRWQGADPINRALSAANACLYGLCHAAILSAGYSPALGFIHTGKQLSFVYDIADLYKLDVTVPAAFQVTAEGEQELERRVRICLRDYFRREKLVGRIIPDIQEILADETPPEELGAYDEDAARPADLWTPSFAPEEKDAEEQ
jgi:CRISPR-associated protein Cas1